MAIYLGSKEVAITAIPKLGKAEITENGKHLAKDHDELGWKEVFVNVPAGEANGTIELNKDGVWDVKNFAKAIVNVGDHGGEFLCQIVDYDGTILKQDHLDTGAVFTLLEDDEFPQHDRITFSEYSSPVVIVDNSVVVENSDIIIGLNYTVNSGFNELDVNINPNSNSVTLYVSDGVVDWGDGSTSTPSSSLSNVSHRYASHGDYTITWSGTIIKERTSSFVIGNIINARLTALNRTYYAFQNINSLETVILPKNKTEISSQMFKSCYKLKCVVIPPNFTKLDHSVFRYCYSLKTAVLDKNLSEISSIFEECYQLTNISLPNKITMSAGAFQKCYGLGNVTLGGESSVSSINNFQYCYGLNRVIINDGFGELKSQTFTNCYGLTIVDMSSYTYIPTLGSTNVFHRSNSLKIYVPDAFYSEWITATNWSYYASYIYKASSKTEKITQSGLNLTLEKTGATIVQDGTNLAIGG